MEFGAWVRQRERLSWSVRDNKFIFIIKFLLFSIFTHANWQLVIEVTRILYFKRIKYFVFLIEVSRTWQLENYHFTKSQKMKRITFCFIFLITFFNILPSKKYLVEVNNEKGNKTDELLPASSDEDATIDGIF